MTTSATKSVQVPLHTYTWGDNAGAVKAFAFFPDANRVVTAGHDDTSTRVWDLERDKEDGEPLLGWHSAPTLSVAVSKHGREIVTGGSDGKVIVWHSETRTVYKILHAGPPGLKILCVAFNATTSPVTVASSGSDGVVNIWKLGSDEYSQTFTTFVIPNKPTVSSIAFAPGSPGVNCIAVASFDKKVRIYDVHSGTPMATFEAHTLYVSSLAWFPAGQLLASAGDKTVHIWDTRIRGREVCPRALVGHSKLVKTVAVSPDGRFIASGSNDGTLRLWNAVTGVQIGSPIVHPDSAGVDIVAFSPDGKVLLSIAKNGGGYVWDMDYLEVEEGVQLMRRVLDDLVTSSAEQQQDMREMFRNEMDEMRQTHERELADLRWELGQARVAEEGRFRDLQAAHDAAMKAQEDGFHALEQALNEAKRAQASQFSEERAAWEVQFSTLRSELQGLAHMNGKGFKELDDAEKSHERGLKELQTAQKRAEETQDQQFKELKKGLLDIATFLKKPTGGGPLGRPPYN